MTCYLTRILLFSFILLFLLPIFFNMQAKAAITCSTTSNYEGTWQTIGGCSSKVCSGLTRNSGTECFMNDQGCDRIREINEGREESVCWSSDQWGPCDLCGTSTSFGVQDFCGTCEGGGSGPSGPGCNDNCWDEDGHRCSGGLSCMEGLGGYNVCLNASCPEETDCVCPEVTSTPTPIPPTNTPTPIPTSTPTPIPTATPTTRPTSTPVPTFTPTPTRIPTSAPTPTPTRAPACGDVCSGDGQCPLICPKCDLVLGCKALPTPTPTSTSTPTLAPPSGLCCIDHTCRAYGSEYWPVGTNCPSACSPSKVVRDYCDPPPGESCRSCSCSRLSDRNFEIGLGQTKDLSVAYVPGICTTVVNSRYSFYALPQISASPKSTSSYNGTIINTMSEEWTNYYEFRANESGYLSSVDIKFRCDSTGYLSALVAKADGTRLSDNRGNEDSQLYGGVESSWFSGTPKEKTISFTFNYLKEYISAGQKYRVYVMPRAPCVGGTGARWTGYNVYVRPSAQLGSAQLGSFSNISPCSGRSSCLVTYTAPSSVAVGTKIDILGEISDNLSIWNGKFGSGNCPFQATIVAGPTMTPTPTPTPTTAPKAWFQTKDADVYAGQNISSRLPNATKYYSQAGLGGFPGVVIYGGSSADFTPGKVSSKGWLANTTITVSNYYDYFYALLGQPTLLPPPDEIDNNVIDASGVYAYNDNIATDEEVLDIGTKTVIVITSGKFLAKGKIRVDSANGGSLLVLAQGGIGIAHNVVASGAINNTFQGIFITDGTFYTSVNDDNFDLTPADSNQILVVDGMVMAGDFNFKRDFDVLGGGDYENRETPAEFFRTDISLIMNQPSLWYTPFSWQEVAP